MSNDETFYRRRLVAFLRERHPHLVHADRLIETRSQKAAEVFRRSKLAGQTTTKASAEADRVLYRGLIFSKFDTLRCILATEFPDISETRQRALAQEIGPYCAEVFGRYTLDDQLVERSEYNHLIVELIDAVRTYFDVNENIRPVKGRPRKS